MEALNMNAQEREKLVFEKCQLENLERNYDRKVIQIEKKLHKEMMKGKSSKDYKLIEGLAKELQITIGSIRAIRERIDNLEKQLA